MMVANSMLGGSAQSMAASTTIWCDEVDDAVLVNHSAVGFQLQGGYRACSRLGIDSNASPFLKISFETATAFLTEATLRGAHDDLSSPAARLVLGRVVESGTGVHIGSTCMRCSAMQVMGVTCA